MAALLASSALLLAEAPATARSSLFVDRTVPWRPDRAAPRAQLCRLVCDARATGTTAPPPGRDRGPLLLKFASVAGAPSTSAGTNAFLGNAPLPQQPAPPAPAATTPAPPASPKLNPTGRDIVLTAPLRDGPFALGEVPFTLTRDDHVLVNAPAVLKAVKPVIDPLAYDKLASGLGGLGDVPVEQFSAFGYLISYDPQTIGLVVVIPPTARTRRDVRLAQLSQDVVGDVDRPAGVAGYVNLRTSADYEWQGSNRGLQSPIVSTDWALRAHGVVLEGEGTLQIGQRGSPTLFQREGTRFVYDNDRLLARVTVGDLLPVTRGFSGAPQMAGVSFARTYSVLQPQRNVQPTGSQTFTVVRPSNVVAFINGQQIRQIRLEPGTYNVRDFPFVQGLNDVRLQITDDSGRQETLEFSLFFDRTLLAKGLTEFGVYSGVLAPTTNTGRNYRFNQPVASGFIRRGISDTLTAGANFQAQKRGGTAGVEVVWASPLGTVGFDLAASHVSGVGSGYALNASIQRTFGGAGSRGKAFALTFETRSPKFATPNDIAADNRYAFEAGATYSQAIGEFQFVSVDGRYSKGRSGFSDQQSARLTYGFRLSERLNLQAQALYDNRNVGGSSWGGRLGLTLRMGGRSSATAEYESRGERGRIGYQTSSGSGVGATSLAVNADYGQGAFGLDGGVSYTANRAELAVSHTTAFDSGGFKVTDQRTSARLGTALVFADGHFAVSRPIYDGFALVTPHRSLKGTQVVVNPSDGHYTARSGVLGGAVANDLSAFADRVVTFDAPKAPAGYDLGAGNIRVYPPYKAGYLVTVGSDYSITAIGTFKLEDGTPVSLLAGEAFELAKPGAKPVTVFTNREGRFGLSGLRPGKWRIEMPTEPKSSAIIEIAGDASGVVRLNDVKLETK